LNLAILKKGVEVWNKWREENPGIRADLSHVKIARADFKNASLPGADLGIVKITQAILYKLNLGGQALSKRNQFLWSEMAIGSFA
jgi:hypothetical protein